MSEQKIKLNSEVTQFLDNLKHPLRKEIEELRLEILKANNALTENIKWNGPNYSFETKDRITMKIQPPKNIQIIFHCGAKVQTQPKQRLIQDESGLLLWKENDRAIATFKNMEDINKHKENLSNIVQKWINATN